MFVSNLCLSKHRRKRRKRTLKEDLQDTSGLLVDETRNTLDTTTTSETTDGGLGDTLNVVTQDLAVTLGSTFAETFAALSTSRHCVFCVVVLMTGEHSWY
jgi:hypothetical protein